MAKLISEHSAEVKDEDATYIVRIYGEKRTDDTWEGWLEFHPTDKSKPVLRTAQETSQRYAAVLHPAWLEVGQTRHAVGGGGARSCPSMTSHSTRFFMFGSYLTGLYSTW